MALYLKYALYYSGQLILKIVVDFASIVSTPKSSARTVSKLLNHSVVLSPIFKNKTAAVSDSETSSSTDDYVTVASSSSNSSLVQSTANVLQNTFMVNQKDAMGT